MLYFVRMSLVDCEKLVLSRFRHSFYRRAARFCLALSSLVLPPMPALKGQYFVIQALAAFQAHNKQRDFHYTTFNSPLKTLSVSIICSRRTLLPESICSVVRNECFCQHACFSSFLPCFYLLSSLKEYFSCLEWKLESVAWWWSCACQKHLVCRWRSQDNFPHLTHFI